MKMLKVFKCIGCILLLAILFTSLLPANVVYAKDKEEEEVGTLESMIAKMITGIANAINKIISLVLRQNGFDR